MDVKTGGKDEQCIKADDVKQAGRIFEKSSVILVDIAGTTTSQEYVQDTLFKFANEKIADFLTKNAEGKDVIAVMKELKTDEEDISVDKAVEIVKVGGNNPAIKTLQGMVYKQGYEDGILKAHVYDDVKKAFAIWSINKTIAIYSTGSIDAQKLLFRYSVDGDLTHYISHYFDQSSGEKTEAESYEKIAKQLNVEPKVMVFITDSIEEAKAAKSAGVHVIIINRDDQNVENSEFEVIKSFSDIGDTNTFKRKVCDTEPDEDSTINEVCPMKQPKMIAEEQITTNSASNNETEKNNVNQTASETDEKPDIVDDSKNEPNAEKEPENLTTESVAQTNNQIEEEKSVDQKNGMENGTTAVHNKKNDEMTVESSETNGKIEAESDEVDDKKTKETTVNGKNNTVVEESSEINVVGKKVASSATTTTATAPGDDENDEKSVSVPVEV